MDINDAWKSTCKVLLGDEIGELDAYKNYLAKYAEPSFGAKSALSGQNLTVTLQNYCQGAKFISHEEMPQYDKMLSEFKLDLNTIKDIDSILDAYQGKFQYAGNQIAGNCSNITESDMVQDSHYVYHSVEVYGSKYVAYSSMARLDEYIFGTNWSGQSKFCIRTFENFRTTRCFETISAYMSNDCYFSATLESCSDCMFSFCTKSRRNLIGNLELPKEDYLKKKQDLLGQARDDLKSKKTTLSIIDLLGGKNDA